MGQDKAAVVFEGRPLWQRQIEQLGALAPQELFISGKADGPYAGGAWEVIEDIHPGFGPLSGLEAAFWRMRSPLLCVLAIDLPWMSAGFLHRLVALTAQDGRGVVPLQGDYFEPLAAIYPRAMLDLVREHLGHADRSLQSLVRHALALDLVVPLAVTDEERPLFRNANSPADLLA